MLAVALLQVLRFVCSPLSCVWRVEFPFVVRNRFLKLVPHSCAQLQFVAVAHLTVAQVFSQEYGSC